MMRESSTLTESKKSRISSYLSIFNWISFLTVSLSVSRMSSRFIFNRPRFIFLFSSGVYNMWGDSNGFSLSYYLVGYPESSNILLQRRAGIIAYTNGFLPFEVADAWSFRMWVATNSRVIFKI